MAENIFIFNPLTALLVAGVATQLFVLVSDNDNRNNLQLDHIFFDSPRCDGQTQQQNFLSESFSPGSDGVMDRLNLAEV